MRFDFHVTGTDSVRARFAGVEERAANFTPAWPNVLRLLEEGEREVFATDGAVLGAAWKSLRASTIAIKHRKGQDPRVMRATGALERSLTTSPRKKEAPRELRFGTALFYATFGRRKTVGVPEATQLRIVEDLREYLIGGA